MRVSRWDHEEQNYSLFDGKGTVLLPDRKALPCSRFGEIPLSRLVVEAEGNFEEFGKSDIPEGVLAQDVHEKEEKNPQENNPLGEFVWAALQYTLLFGLISQLFKKD